MVWVSEVVQALVRCGPASPCHYLTLRWFRSLVGRQESADGKLEEWTGGSVYGPSTLWRSEVAVPVVRRCFSHGCSVSFVVTSGCSVPTSWRYGMLVLLLAHVFDSVGSVGVIFGLTRGCGRVPTALVGRDSLS
ncbi:hypothetical protein Taro_042446 [Colocasia esculenta]|uniref:Uncharacterized protein n=1 Tax=Colocasia esculenta TaxID=4460 RepID=A0A843WIH1_COLES|nr:hypothetical protein [Colocasia esculenta]